MLWIATFNFRQHLLNITCWKLVAHGSPNCLQLSLSIHAGFLSPSSAKRLPDPFRNSGAMLLCDCLYRPQLILI